MRRQSTPDRKHRQPELPRQKRTAIWVCLGLILLMTVVYGQVARHEFVAYDDDVYVYMNDHVCHGLSWEGVRYAFGGFHHGNWHPLTWLSLMLDAEIYGENAGGFHTTNLLFHAANVLLLFTALRLMTGAVWRSAMVAALLAVHPLHVESVAWVTERKDVLSTLFWMLSLLAYTAYVRRGNVGYYALTTSLMALGLMAKSMLVTLPCVLLLLDFWPLDRLQLTAGKVVKRTIADSSPNPHSPFETRSFGCLLLEKLPLLGLSAASGLVTALAQHSGRAYQSLESLPIAARIGHSLVTYVAYLGKMIWPVKLAVFYPHPGSSTTWQVISAILLLGVLTWLALWGLARRRYLMVGWFWYLGTLVPVIGIVQVGMQAMADRYTYVPLIGIYILIAWGVTDLADRWPATRPAIVAVIPTVILGLALLTWHQLGHWKNTVLLFQHALAVTDRSPIMQYNLGVVFEGQRQYPKAERHLREAVRLNPDYGDAHHNLGTVLQKKGQYLEAETHLRAALRIDSERANSHNNLGGLFETLHQYPKAEQHLREALRLEPELRRGRYNLGNLLAKQGRWAEAATYLRGELVLNSEHAQSHNTLGFVLAAQKQYQQAATHLHEALRLDPELRQAYYNLGDVLEQQGQHRQAETQMRELVRLDPQHVKAHISLGRILAAQGEYQQAATHLNEAVRIDPKHAEALGNLAGVMASLHKYEDAIRYYRSALKLNADFGSVMNNLAWLHATHPREDLRDGAVAVRLAERACQITEDKDPTWLDTLAAAYAEAGRFEDSVATAKRALELAKSNDLPRLADEIQSRLALYQQGQPFRDQE